MLLHCLCLVYLYTCLKNAFSVGVLSLKQAIENFPSLLPYSHHTCCHVTRSLMLNSLLKCRHDGLIRSNLFPIPEYKKLE